VPLPSGTEVPLREALITSYDIRSLNKRLLAAWSERSGSPFLRALVESGSREEIEEFCWGRELIDLINDHPADFADGEEFVSVLKKLQPRLYSIASSPNAHPGEVHLTVAIVRYNSHGRDRGGVCSTYLSDRVGDVCSGVFVHNNKAFRLPEDHSKDIIMVGPEPELLRSVRSLKSVRFRRQAGVIGFSLVIRAGQPTLFMKTKSMLGLKTAL
ncbi:MAG: hypothetical protein ACJ0HK_08205, partial [Akkermansiaceae bacterium]